jgi:ankyrin repeat protein
MKKSNFLFIQYVLLTVTILLGYTHCRCTPSPPDTSQSSSPADSDNNTTPPTTITQEMIDIVTDTVTNDPLFQFLLDRLQELKNGDKTNIDKQNAPFFNYTALHYAARLGNPSIVAALLKLGADPTLKESYAKNLAFIVSFIYDSDKVLETGETFLNDPKVASFINLEDKNNAKPLVRIEEKIQDLDLNTVTDYPKIKELLILREKMIEKGAIT